MEAATAPDARVLTFHLGGEPMGMDAQVISEIIPPPRLTRVPHAPGALLGMAGLRGDVVPVLSLARLLKRQDAPIGRVIVADLGGPVGLAVTAVSQMMGRREAEGTTLLDMAALIAQAMPERRARQSTGGAIDRVSHRNEQVETVALIAFCVAGQEFALPLSATLDVMALPAGITAMPLSDRATIGSIGWRGRVLPLLGLAGLLGLGVDAPPIGARVVVVRIGGHHLGLVVDAMRSVERVREQDIDPVPPLLNRGAEARIQAICRLEGGTRLLSILATDHLVGQDITAGLLKTDSTQGEAMDEDTGEQDMESFLMVRIGQEHYGLPIEAVQQVAMLSPALTPLPRAPDFVRGVMQIRGEVIPVIDQSRRFHGTASTSARRRVVVVRTGDLTAGFIVDEVRSITRLPSSALREAPDLGVAGMRLFDRVASPERGEALVMIVSPRDLLDRAERDMLADLGREGATSRS